MFKDIKKQDEFENFIMNIEDATGFFDPHIKLKSGRPGHYYFDFRNVYNSRILQQTLAGYILDFALENGIKPKYFLGVPQGATSTATAINYKIDYQDDMPVPILRIAPKGHGDPRDRASVGHLERGTPVALVEDVTTTGRSSMEYLLYAQNAGLDVLAFIAILNRLELRDGGLYVSEFFDKIMHTPFYKMTNAERMLPKMYKKLKPPKHVVRKTEKYLLDYCGREVRLASPPKIGDQAVESQRAFEREYMFKVPYDGFVNGCSLVKFSTLFNELPDDKNPDDLCLNVFLRKQLPQEIRLPDEYEGLPVIKRIMGELYDEEPCHDEMIEE